MNMNLLCPNCQKMLTVPDQYAGQLMKCPLCNGTFTVPSLPAAPAPPSFEPAPAQPQAPLPPPAPPPAAPEAYGLREPDLAPSSPPPAPPSAPPPSDPLAVQPPPPELMTPPPPPAPEPPKTPLGYTRTRACTLSPKVLQWVPPVALLLVFILSFFPWVGIYPGGFPIVYQSAWGAAFGSYAEDKDFGPSAWPSRDDMPSGLPPVKKADFEPGVSLLLIFYLLLFVLIFPVTAAVLVLDVGGIRPPGGLASLWPWRWGIVTILLLLLMVFFGLQRVVDFSLEAKVKEQASKAAEAAQKDIKGTKGDKVSEIIKGLGSEFVDRTFALRLAFWLNLLALVCAALTFWLNQRERQNRPLPRLEWQT
jgi:hypothetical protein